MGGVDQEIQPALGQRVVVQHAADRADLQAEFLVAHDVALAFRSLLQGFDEAVDFELPAPSAIFSRSSAAAVRKFADTNLLPGGVAEAEPMTTPSSIKTSHVWLSA